MHFCVLVAGNDVDEALKPFQENNMDDCLAEYLEFNDIEDEYLNKYNTQTTEVMKSPNGQYEFVWDYNRLVNRGEMLSSQWHLTKVPFTELYSSFEEFMSKFCNEHQRDPVKQRYGYYENPNAKWDWYQIGGRWTGGLLKLKPDVEFYGKGLPGVFGSQEKEGWVDQARICDIDFIGMKETDRQNAAEVYDSFYEALGDNKIKLLEDFSSEEMGIDVAREEYLAQPGVKALMRSESPFLSNWIINIEMLLSKTREEYINETRSGLLTYAILIDGQWHSRYESSLLSAEKDESERSWQKRFDRLLFSINPNTIVSVVDCHI